MREAARAGGERRATGARVAVPRSRAPALLTPHTFFRAIKVVSNISECCLVTFHRLREGANSASSI